MMDNFDRQTDRQIVRYSWKHTKLFAKVTKRLCSRLLVIGGYVKSCKNQNKMQVDFPIDIVVTWVDGSDERWQAEKSKFQGDNSARGNGKCRYRTWEHFKYWYRAVEKYAPWVNNVYLVTWGHVPNWLDLECSKLKVVKHTEFIPEEYLPTFSSIPIEFNLHRIPGLSEHFIYFNDDMFLARPCKPEDFFRNRVPLYSAISEPLYGIGNQVPSHILFSTICALNQHNDISKCIEQFPQKWFSRCYGRLRKHNAMSYKGSHLYGLFFSHVGVPYCKTQFEKTWIKYPEIASTCTNRFRTPLDVMHHLIAGDAMLSGEFEAITHKHWGKVFNMDRFERIQRAFEQQECLMVCFNDAESYTDDDIETIDKRLIEILNTIFPEKSVFEK